MKTFEQLTEDQKKTAILEEINSFLEAIAEGTIQEGTIQEIELLAECSAKTALLRFPE
jgi:hypothetical protein